jgi:membrane associated rhomboid family serine protease
MLPLQDINPTRRFPIVTLILIAVNVLVYLVFQAPLGDRAGYELALDWAVVPVLITRSFDGEAALDIFRAMFMHGSLVHLGSNMLYLWIFGDNLEDRLGIPLYLGFYFLSGIAATLAQIMIDPQSPIPMLGASGAIAGVLGGYLVLFPGVRVRGLIFFGYFVRLAEISAVWVLGLWFALQLFNGLTSLGMVSGGGVAFFAHIGGFVAGVVLMWLFTRMMPQPPLDKRRQMLYDRYDPREGHGYRW